MRIVLFIWRILWFFSVNLFILDGRKTLVWMQRSLSLGCLDGLIKNNLLPLKKQRLILLEMQWL
jgi:hypothetical protein